MKRTVEIVGAGIAGLTAGLAFAQKGWRVRVHEQARTLHCLGDGIHLWENGLRVLDALGVLAPIISGISPASGYERRYSDGRTFSSGHFGCDFRLYLTSHARLLTSLYGALLETGGEVVFNSRAVAAEPDGALHLADGSSLHADLTVGADGINSSTRDSLGLLKWRRPANQFGYRAAIRRSPGISETIAECMQCEYWSGSRRLLYAPATTKLAFVELTSPTSDSAGNAVPIDRQDWTAFFPNLTGIIDRIPDDSHGEWFEIVRPEFWSSGRVAIIGDAAIAQPPFLGHGAGCSIMAAFALAQTIDRAGDVAAGLTEWELRERPFTDWVQWVVYRYGQLALLPAAARTAVFKGIDASRWVKRRILLGAVCRDVTETSRYLPAATPIAPVCPLIH